MRYRFALLVLVVWWMVPRSVAEPTIEEQWYVVLNGEDRVGYMHATHEAKDGQLVTGQEVKLVIGRAGSSVSIEVASMFTETPDGVPLEATSSLNMGGVPLQSRAVFDGLDGPIQLTAGQAGRDSTVNMPAIGEDWMPPAAMQRYVEQQLAEGAEQIHVKTLDVSMGLTPIDMTMQVVGREDVEVYGKTVPAIVWEASVSAMPGIKLREYVDEQGTSIKSTMALMPGLELTVLQADKALALSELTPAEMMAQTFVVPNQKIDRPRELTQARYRLSMKNGQPLPTLFNGGPQRLGDDGEVTVDMRLAEAEPEPGEAYLRASPMLNHEDPAVQKWLEPMQTKKFASQDAMVEALRRMVHNNIDTKDLSVGFATASDVARTKQGDCTEHAVLLAALLRGSGIPARCVSGLVYADQFAGHEGIFGYHMWTQAWIDGRWVDTDATLPGDTRFDATHIAIGVSDMNEGLVTNDMAALVPLLGNLQIEVVETGYGSH